jgi:hypothetical protein
LKKICLVKKQIRLFHHFGFLEKIRSNTTLIAVRRITLENFSSHTSTNHAFEISQENPHGLKCGLI